MNKHDQAKLLESVLDNMKASLLTRVEHFPENWDGIEIRQYVADKFRNDTRPMHLKRLRRYKNDVMTRPL